MSGRNSNKCRNNSLFQYYLGKVQKGYLPHSNFFSSILSITEFDEGLKFDMICDFKRILLLLLKIQVKRALI